MQLPDKITLLIDLDTNRVEGAYFNKDTAIAQTRTDRSFVTRTYEIKDALPAPEYNTKEILSIKLRGKSEIYVICANCGKQAHEHFPPHFKCPKT